MYSLRQAKLDVYDVPKIAIYLLLGIFLLSVFDVGFDQGHLFSAVQGKKHLIQNGFMNFTTICDMQLDFLVID